MSTAPKMPYQVRCALEHVRASHPEVVQVFYDREARWLFLSDEHVAPEFGPEIDTNLLEDAADSVPFLPCAFDLESAVQS